ncbi:hypothetical protein D3C72_1330170 [compost metagenome]
MPGVAPGVTPLLSAWVPTCLCVRLRLPVRRDQLMPCWYSLLRRTSMMVASISTWRLALCNTASRNSAIFSCWRPVARTAIKPPSTLTTTDEGVPLLASFSSGMPFASSGWDGVALLLPCCWPGAYWPPVCIGAWLPY